MDYPHQVSKRNESDPHYPEFPAAEHWNSHVIALVEYSYIAWRTDPLLNATHKGHAERVLAPATQAT